MPSPKTPWEQTVTAAMGECVAVFGEGDDQVSYTHQGGTAYTLDGIWDAESVTVDPDTGALIVSNQPMIAFALADMQEFPDNGDTVVARGVTYTVKEPQFDGQGTVTLLLFRM